MIVIIYFRHLFKSSSERLIRDISPSAIFIVARRRLDFSQKAEKVTCSSFAKSVRVQPVTKLNTWVAPGDGTVPIMLGIRLRGGISQLHWIDLSRSSFVIEKLLSIIILLFHLNDKSIRNVLRIDFCVNWFLVRLKWFTQRHCQELFESSSCSHFSYKFLKVENDFIGFCAIELMTLVEDWFQNRRRSNFLVLSTIFLNNDAMISGFPWLCEVEFNVNWMKQKERRYNSLEILTKYPTFLIFSM